MNEGHGHSVGRIGVGEARVGDRACAKLIRKTEVERNWGVSANDPLHS